MFRNVHKSKTSLLCRATTLFMSLLLCTSLVPAPALARVPEDDGEVATVSQPTDNAATVESTNDAAAETEPKDAAGDQDAASSDKQNAAPVAADSAEPTDKAATPEPARAPAADGDLYVDADGGSDDADGSAATPLKNLPTAVAKAKSGNTIHLKGSFILDTSVTIPAGVTLDIYGDTNITGKGNNGITLASGATLKGSNGVLTMTGFAKALTAQKNSLITDGTYNFKNNAQGSSNGISLEGTIKGSSGKDKLKITANDKDNTNFFTGATHFENCTINVTSQKRTWSDGKDLTLINSSFTYNGFGMSFYVNKLTMNNSELTANNTTSYGGTGLTIQASGTISNSTVNINAGSTAGFSVGGTGTKLLVENSTIKFTNNGVGGLNVNTGEVYFKDSTLEGNGKQSGALFGAQQNGYIEFDENSRVESPAKSNGDTGAGQTETNYVVVGGSHKVKYEPNYNSSSGSTIPNNGTDNGNEKLMLFTLTDPSINTLSPLNKNGETYTYQVANASSDGQKHVWVPEAKVTFKLNNADATFADDTTADKKISTIRGYEPDAVTGNTNPGTPTDKNGVKFLGWYYKDSTGAEHAFNYDGKVSTNLEVYAKWDAKTVIYHNGDGESYIQTLDSSATSAQALSYDEVVKGNKKFARDGKDFISWSTAENGGEEVAAGSELGFKEGMTQIDLYAQWNAQKYTVSFSANGGKFSDDSVFKKNPDVFEIKQDADGGDVAVIKQTAEYGQTLHDILGSFDYNKIKPDTKAKKAHEVLADNAYWNESASGKGEDRRFDDTSLWVFSTPGYNPTLTKDVTYYLKWKTDPAVQEIKQDLTLDGDMWSISEETSSKLQHIRPDKETFSITGQIDAQPIQEQMKKTEALFPDAANEPDKIMLDQLKSNFTATFTMPDGVKVTDNPKIIATGLGDCFTLGDVTQVGNTITVKFNLKGGISTYKELQDAVASVGKDDTQTGILKQMRRAIDSQVTPAKIKITIDGFTLDGNKVTEDGKLFHMDGKVMGNFSSYATHNTTTKKFVFGWNAKQATEGNDEAGQGTTVNDAKPAANGTISYTVAAVLPANATLPGDILINKNTTNSSTYGVLPGQKVDVTGALNVKAIKDQMVGIETQYPNVEHNKIDVDIRNFGFVAKFTVPNEMKLPELTKDDLKLENFGGFKIVDAKVEGNTVVVKMDLADEIATYDQLENAVDSAGDPNGWMKIIVPGVEIKSDTGEGKQLTVTGTVEGSFDALATSQNSGKNRRFLFTWKAEQWAEGKDSIATDDKVIQATLETPATVTQGLPGDIRIGDETEHEVVYPTKPSATLDYAGWLNKQSIQEQMSNIEKLYPNVTDYSKLAVDVPNCTFTATFTIPDGLTLPSAVKATAKDFGPYFSITNTKVSSDGKTVTVTMKLDTTNISTYADLQKAVQQAGDAGGWMKVIIPGVKVNADAKNGTRLTVVGTVAGDMQATATSEGGTTKAFRFHWDGEQWADGKDATAPADDTSIRFTVEVKANSTKPDNPDKPDKPNKPNKPSKPDNGKKITKKVTKKAVRKVLPQTSDLLLPVGGVAVAGIVIVAAAIILRKRNK